MLKNKKDGTDVGSLHGWVRVENPAVAAEFSMQAANCFKISVVGIYKGSGL